jgi:tetratricopeptide (TPR) repeat protein
MSEVAARRDPLPHAVLFERMAAAPSLVEARLAQGALLTLRVVDLLAADPDSIPLGAFHYQCAATERFCRGLPANGTETAHLLGLLRAAADAFAADDVRLVIPALCAYAHFLEDELHLERAFDVLETVTRVSAERASLPERIGVALSTARVLRKLNRFDDADAAYAEAQGLAEGSGDLRSVLLGRIGRAVAIQGRGDLQGAESALRRILVDRRTLRAHNVEATAWHALGTTLLLRGQLPEAITCVWRAFERFDDELSQLRALNEVGIMLLCLGEADAAHLALSEVVRRGRTPDTVTNALIELMHCASYRRDRVGFERWRTRCRSLHDRMPPNMKADFLLKAGIGYARFGSFSTARKVIAEALAVAQTHGLHELEFRIERIGSGLQECERGQALAPLALQKPARHPSLRDVRLSLNELSHVDA